MNKFRLKFIRMIGIREKQKRKHEQYLDEMSDLNELTNKNKEISIQYLWKRTI